MIVFLSPHLSHATTPSARAPFILLNLSLSLFCQLIGLQMHPQYTKWTNKALQNIIRLKAIRYIYHCYCYYY